MLHDLVIGFLRGYTGPPEVAADELIRMIRQWDRDVEAVDAR